MIEVLVPLEQEGTEAVVAGWLRAVGDRVALNDPLVELETDKVTVEVPAPVAGILSEIVIAAGGAALPGAVLARIETAGAALPAARGPQPQPAPENAGAAGDMAHWHSPAVRRALAQTGIDPAGINGTGRGGRLTRADVDRAAEALRAAQAVPASPAPTTQVSASPTATTPHTPAPGPTDPGPTDPGRAAPDRPAPGGGAPTGRMVPHDPMRLAIARNMLKSVSTAPQVTAVFEADFSAIIAHRARHRAAFEARGTALSYTAYIVLAAARAMAAAPQVNSRWHDDRLEIFDDINIGIGTALGDKGLIVPVIRQVQNLSLEGVAAQLQDLTARARRGALTAEQTRGGTFTISNHGVSGSLFAAPIIINQPQSAILGIGKLEKRVVVREIAGTDAMLIRPMAYVSLTIDHRSLDGHQTNGWLAAFVSALEGWS